MLTRKEQQRLGATQNRRSPQRHKQMLKSQKSRRSKSVDLGASRDAVGSAAINIPKIKIVSPDKTVTESTSSSSSSSSSSPDTNQVKNTQRRYSSPASVPEQFRKKVGFDTIENKDASVYSFSLKAQHKDYVYSRLSRTFLIGLDDNTYSQYALEYLMDELVDNGDEIVCLRVIDYGSKVVDPANEEREYRQKAYELLQYILSKNEDDKNIGVVLEFAVGKVKHMIKEMIRLYEPVLLVVGTKGKSTNGFQGLLPGSISKWCLQHSPVPVVVVHPTDRRKARKAKQMANPNRRTYLDILEKSNDGSTVTRTLDMGGTAGSKPLPLIPNSSTGELVPTNMVRARSSAGEADSEPFIMDE